MIESPSFGISITLLSFFFALKIAGRLKHPLVNPTLISSAMVILLLWSMDIPFDTYNEGGKYISLLLGPATVALGVLLYKQWSLVKDNWQSILIGITVGSVMGIVSAVLIARLLGGNREIILTMAPKSITTPIAIEVSRIIGGVPPLTAAVVSLTGLFGAVFGPALLRFFGVKDPIAIGVAIGTSSHGLGTSRAVLEGEVQGSMSGLSIGVAGLISAILIPIIVKVLM